MKYSYCTAQVGKRLCENKIYKDDYCKKHYKMFSDLEAIQKDYIITLTMEVVGCYNQEEAIEQFTDVVKRKDYKLGSFIIKEKK